MMVQATAQQILQRAFMALEDEPETVRIAGRQVLIEQAPHILADISAARRVLDSLLERGSLAATPISIAKEVDCE